MNTILDKDTMSAEQLKHIKQKAAQALLDISTSTNAAYNVLRYAAAGFYEVTND